MEAEGRTEALLDLAVQLFARGLSTRDSADRSTTFDGQPLSGRAVVGESSVRRWDRGQVVVNRNRTGYGSVRRWVDGSAQRLCSGRRRDLWSTIRDIDRCALAAPDTDARRPARIGGARWARPQPKVSPVRSP